MKSLVAMKSVVLLLVVFIAMMALLRLLIVLGATEYVTMPPEMTVEEFVSALGSRRHEAVPQLFRREFKNIVNDVTLNAITTQLEQRYGRLDHAQHRTTLRLNCNHAFVTELLTFERRASIPVQFSLSKEQQLWKLDSLEPVRALLIS
jgi:hypothetical protein